MSPQSFSVVPSSGPLRPSLTGTAAARSVASSHDEAGSASGTFDAALAGLDCVPDQKLGNAPSLASSPPPPPSPKDAPSLSSSSSSARPHDVGVAVVAPKPASLASPTSPLVAAVGPHQAPSPSSARPHDVGVSVVASKPASPASPLVAAVGPQQAPSLPLAPQLQPALPARNADSVMSRVNQGPLEARRSSSSSSWSSFSEAGVVRCLAVCADDNVRRTVNDLDSLSARGAELLIESITYPTRFSTPEAGRLLFETVPARSPRLDLPFQAVDVAGTIAIR